jgi:hypothetical protein
MSPMSSVTTLNPKFGAARKQCQVCLYAATYAKDAAGIRQVPLRSLSLVLPLQYVSWFWEYDSALNLRHLTKTQQKDEEKVPNLEMSSQVQHEDV